MELDTDLWKFWTKRRYILIMMCFLGFCNVYSLRVNLSVAIVAMTQPTKITHENGTIEDGPPLIDYSKQQQGVILSAFFYGYILTQVLGGIIVRKVSAHIVYGIGIVMTAILTLLTPLIAHNFAALVSIRVIEGIFEGVTFPCLHSMLSKWAPPWERTRMNSIAFAGNYIGTVISMPVSGLLGEAFGWESIFYVFGALGCLWYLVWLIMIRENPEKDPRCSQKERDYIKKSLGTTVNHEKPPSPPWKEMFMSTAVWAIIFAHFAENWGYYTMLTQLPTFLNDVIGYPLAKAGFTSSLPYLTMGVLLAPIGYMADFFITRNILSVTNVRRFFNCGGFIAQTVFMMTAGYLRDPISIIACITLGVGLGAFSISGFACNHLDIAPQHAAILMGITNTFGTLPGMISPLLTGAVVKADPNKIEERNDLEQQWQIIFIVSASVYLVGCVVYWFFASGEIQPWAIEKKIDNDLEYQKKNKDDTFKKTGDIGGYDNPAADLDGE